MLDRLNWLGAEVNAGAGYTDVQVIIRDGQAAISRAGEPLLTVGGVVGVVPDGPRSRVVNFADGSTWNVSLPERKGGCGCR